MAGSSGWLEVADSAAEPGTPALIGVQGGRVWHYRSTSWMGYYYPTACGLKSSAHWRPRNARKVGVCARCRKVWEEQHRGIDGGMTTSQKTASRPTAVQRHLAEVREAFNAAFNDPNTHNTDDMFALGDAIGALEKAMRRAG